MNKYKNILKVSGTFLLSLLIYTLIITILSFFDIVSSNVLNIINFIVVSILMFISGFSLAKVTHSKGYKAGLIVGLLNMVILLFISIILRGEITSNILLYFLILLLSSMIGGMAGINFNNNQK